MVTPVVRAPGPALRASHAGFTYLMLLWWVAISGFMLAAMAQSWMLDARREREAELAFRGEQIRQALQSYLDGSPAQPPRLPERFEDLLEDRRGGTVKRHLRRLFKDPITHDGDWGLIKEGAGIKGVYSLSPQVPLKGANPYTSYAEWRFEVDMAAASAAASSPASTPAFTPAKPRRATAPVPLSKDDIRQQIVTGGF